VRPGPIGHFGAVIGAVLYVVMAKWLSVPSLVAMIVTVVVVFAVRVAALRFGIQVPTALDLPRTINRVKTRPRRHKTAHEASRRSGRRIRRS
jgi:hypothetical protein